MKSMYELTGRDRSFEIVGIAFVVRDWRTGETAVFGSNELERVSIESRIGFDRLSDSSTTISAQCRTLIMQRVAPVATPPPEQRGIYLPDLSFRALPD